MCLVCLFVFRLTTVLRILCRCPTYLPFIIVTSGLAVALDFVSLASYSDRTDGNLAHQTMLGMFHNRFILIIEDVNLRGLPAGFLKQVSAVPLLVQGIDSSPVTMWAEY